jgi:hypothetical protein
MKTKKRKARRARPFSRPDPFFCHPYFCLSERIPKARLFEMIRSCVKRAVLALEHLDQYADELKTLMGNMSTWRIYSCYSWLFLSRKDSDLATWCEVWNSCHVMGSHPMTPCQVRINPPQKPQYLSPHGDYTLQKGHPSVSPLSTLRLILIQFLPSICNNM